MRKKCACRELREGDEVDVQDIRAEQHFTQPPPRYSEASLVKALEEYGIGRPSTYASIIYTLVSREYAEIDRAALYPHRYRPGGGAVPGKTFLRLCRLRVHRPPGRRTGRSVARASVTGCRCWRSSGSPLSRRSRKRKSRSRGTKPSRHGCWATDPKTGKPVSVRLGRYGPHAMIGTRDDEDKPQFAGLRRGQSLETITLEEALELFKLPRDLGFTPEGEEVAAGIGRFGPFIRYGSKFVSLKDHRSARRDAVGGAGSDPGQETGRPGPDHSPV